MKRFAIIITLIILVLFGAYLWFDYFIKSPRSYDLISYVPESAAFVVETNNFPDTWNSFTESSSWQSLNGINAVRQTNLWLGEIDSLSEKKGVLDQLTKQGLLISGHKTSQSSLDIVLYVNISTSESQESLAQILKLMEREKSPTLSTRVYQGFEIQEVVLSSDHAFSYIIDDNMFIGSFTPFLVEDVIRLIQGDFKSSFYSQNASFETVPKLGTDEGNLYIDMDGLNDLGNVLTSEVDIVDFATSCYFDFSINKDYLLLSGFTETTPLNYLSTLADQSPQKNNFKYYLPNNIGYYYQIGLEDGLEWHSNLLDYWNSRNQDFINDRLQFADTYNFDFERAYSWLGKGLALSCTPTVTKESDKLIIVDSKDINEALNHLNVFSESLNNENDSAYIEKFGELTIRELPVNEFPYFIWGAPFNGFERTFYTVIDDYLIMAEKIEIIKALVTDIETENTLGRSVDYNKFQSTTLEESNFKVIVNTSRIMDTFVDKSSASWQGFLQENLESLNDFRFIGIDFSSLDDNFYSNISINHSYSEAVRADDNQSLKGISIALNYPLATKPFVVRSHVDNSKEVLLQDSLNYIMLISASGEKLWERKIGGRIVSGVNQVDYYKNGKLQYFFTTENQIYIIDRLGNMVEDFPKSVDFNIASSNVLDYDNSKRYRYLISDQRGNLYLYTKEGIPLEGWDPKNLTGRLAADPFHLRVRGQDIIVALQNDGTVNAFNRRGESKPGFPVKLDGRFDSDIHIKMGINLSTTALSMVSTDGLLVEINLKGEILSAEQLYKPNQESSFNLVVDALDKTYIIVRQDLNRLDLINSEGSEFLAKDYLNEGDLSIQYYNFSSINQLYVVTDIIQAFSYVYDASGTLVSSRPIDSQFDVSMMYYESTKTYEIFVSSGSTFKRLNF